MSYFFNFSFFTLFWSLGAPWDIWLWQIKNAQKRERGRGQSAVRAQRRSRRELVGVVAAVTHELLSLPRLVQFWGQERHFGGQVPVQDWEHTTTLIFT